MRKLLLIAIKDLKIALRDRASVIFMLLAPFVLTIGLGLVTGSFSSSSGSGIQDIAVVVVNDDGGSLGNALVEMLESDDLADLLEPQLVEDVKAAYTLVDEDKATAAIYIPEGFTASIIPTEGELLFDKTVQVELYGNPTNPTKLGVIETILERFMIEVENNSVENHVAFEMLLENSIMDPSQINSMAQTIGMDQTKNTETLSSTITLDRVTAAGKEVEFNLLAILAPGMALMFLMYTVTFGARTLLVEQVAGTLPRLLISPTASIQVLAGKVLGIFLTGVTQMLVLVLGSSLLFKLNWGDPLAVFVLILAAVLASTSWGILLASLLKTPGQISNIGSALMLIFGILSGGFFSISAMPAWVQLLSRVSPNRWGLDGFTTLAMGGNLIAILGPVLALIIMAISLFMVAVMFFKKRGIGRQ